MCHCFTYFGQTWCRLELGTDELVRVKHVDFRRIFQIRIMFEYIYFLKLFLVAFVFVFV